MAIAKTSGLVLVEIFLTHNWAFVITGQIWSVQSFIPLDFTPRVSFSQITGTARTYFSHSVWLKMLNSGELHWYWAMLKSGLCIIRDSHWFAVSPKPYKLFLISITGTSRALENSVCILSFTYRLSTRNRCACFFLRVELFCNVLSRWSLARFRLNYNFFSD